MSISSTNTLLDSGSAMTGTRALSLFSTLDQQKNGELDRSDFLEFYAAVADAQPTPTELKPSFATPESQFSGVKETFSLRQSFGVRWSLIKDHAETAFKNLDTGSTGTIDLKSFMAHFGFDETGAPLPAPQPPSAEDPAALFATYDSNHDGAITSDELSAAMANDPSQPTSLADVMSAWDTNKDGAISQQEFTDGYALIKQATGIISTYDKAGKGYFDEADLQAALQANPTASTGPTAADLMAFWDANGDGKVTVPDVLQGLARGGSVAQSETPTVDQTSLDNLYAAYGFSTAAPSTS